MFTGLILRRRSFVLVERTHNCISFEQVYSGTTSEKKSSLDAA